MVNRDDLLFQLGRDSADSWVNEQDERANLEWFASLGDDDMVAYTRGRLSTLPGYDEESEGSHG